jgi:hypothetical protein
MLLLCTVMLCTASVAHAEPLALSPADVARAANTNLPLTQLRLDAHSTRRTAGEWLLGWGLVSTVAGTVIAIAERDHQAMLSAGIATASFGVVNALLAPSLLDLSGERERDIHTDARTPAAIREAEIVSNLKTGQTFAVNAGLDVFYIAAGLLVFALGHQQTPRVRWEEGVGVAMAIQGLPLLAFDIVNWMSANARATRFQGLQF